MKDQRRVDGGGEGEDHAEEKGRRPVEAEEDDEAEGEDGRADHGMDQGATEDLGLGQLAEAQLQADGEEEEEEFEIS